MNLVYGSALKPNISDLKLSQKFMFHVQTKWLTKKQQKPKLTGNDFRW